MKIGRSQSWWKIKLESKKKIIGIWRDKYNVEKKKKILAAGPNSFFKCVNAFLGKGASEPWDVATLFPGLDDKQVAEEAAGFFNRMSA